MTAITWGELSHLTPDEVYALASGGEVAPELDEWAAAHCRECSDCREWVEAMRRIERDSLEAPPPRLEEPDRLLAGFHRRIAALPSSMPGLPHDEEDGAKDTPA